VPTVTISRGVRAVNPNPVLPASPAVIVGDTPKALGAHPKALLVAEGGPVFVFPLAPLSTKHGGYAPSFGEVDREGRKGTTYISGLPVETLTFSCLLKAPVFDPDAQVSIEETLLEPLRVTVAAAPRFTIQRMGFTERGIWACDDLQFETIRRQHGTNLTTQATATFSFREWISPPAVAKVGPASGGAVVPPAVPAPAAATTKPAPQSYVVVRGDSLVKISTRFYGTPDRWRDLASANRVANPALIYPGQRLTIPRP
jgi:LysM repeat protein